MPIREAVEATVPHKAKQLDVERLLLKLTLPEKVSLLSGRDNWHTRDIPALNIPALRLSDGPNGCRGTKFFEGVPAACFPCATGLASTWDLELVRRVGEAIGEECKAKGVHVLLAPTVNMHRTPLNGRGFESFSEDPFLSGWLAAAFIRGCQGTGVAAALKHLVANDQETQRYSISAEMDERTLREIYLKPFEIAVKEASPWVVMTSYNRVNGLHCSETSGLIDGILRGEWGWDGMTVSDWHGTYSIVEAIKAGLDLEMPGPGVVRGAALTRMITCGKLAERDLDDRVRNVLKLVNRTSAAGIPWDAEEATNPAPAIDVLRQSAADAVVLLKNDAGILPLSTEVRSIAVIGPNAARAEIFGGGSAQLAATYKTTPLQGIRASVNDCTEIIYKPGCDAHKLTPLIGELTTNSQGDLGFDISFFNEIGNERIVIHSLTTTNSNMFFNDNLPDDLNKACYAEVTATFCPPASGVYEFGIGTLGTADLYINDCLLIDNSTAPVPGDLFFGKGTREETATIELEKGVAYRLRIDYASPSASTGFVGPLALNSRGGLRFGGYQKVAPEVLLFEAVEAAQLADTVVVVVGLNAEYETEGYDRPDMQLPKPSLALVNAILKVRPDAVICIQSGTPVELPFASRASTMLQLFYNGNETGNGLADVIFGRTNPSAKLPFSYPLELKDLMVHQSRTRFPGVDGKVHYEEGVFVGYRQLSTFGGAPLFSFGHGLSYTHFEVSESAVAEAGDLLLNMVVRCQVTNWGSRAGREVLQVYVRPPRTGNSSFRPERELRAFVKTNSLEPGETEVVEMSLDRTSFAYYGSGCWQVVAGTYTILIGTSSEDIREVLEVGMSSDSSFS